MRICKYIRGENLPTRAPIDNLTQGPTETKDLSRNEYRSFKLKKIFKKL